MLNNLYVRYFLQRMKQIEYFVLHPHEVQERLFYQLLHCGKNTAFGKEFNFSEINNPDSFGQQVPVSEYHNLFPYIQRMLQGEQNILWNSKMSLFSKSSGTTNEQSKFIPMSKEALHECHFKAGRDTYTLYCNLYPDSKIFDGYALGMGGHLEKNKQSGAFEGDLSALLMKKLPYFAQRKRKPDLEIALMDEWESKINKIADSTIPLNITHILGVPSWTQLLLRCILEKTGKHSIRDVWPHLEVFFHGGVNFSPYKAEFQRLILDENMHYIQTYNASEGYFSIQDCRQADDMLLLLNHGIYYEFMPMSELGKGHPKLLRLDQVECDINYALVITTNSGLWRYLIGDTVIFTSTNPYRIRVSGRTRYFINAVGEEVILDNVEKALNEALKHCPAIIEEYTGGPLYAEGGEKARHEWVFEFIKQPDNLSKFAEIFDQALQNANSDYAAKRYRNMILDTPLIHVAPQGAFYKWMKQKGKLGGQYKVPRLANERKHLDTLLPLCRTTL